MMHISPTSVRWLVLPPQLAAISNKAPSLYTSPPSTRGLQKRFVFLSLRRNRARPGKKTFSWVIRRNASTQAIKNAQSPRSSRLSPETHRILLQKFRRFTEALLPPASILPPALRLPKLQRLSKTRNVT